MLAAAVLIAGLAAGTAGQVQNVHVAPPSPAQQNIERAQAQIQKSRERYQAYNQFALALAQRARETSDVSYYAKAEEALELTISPCSGYFLVRLQLVDAANSNTNPMAPITLSTP